MQKTSHEGRYKILEMSPIFLINQYTKGVHHNYYEVIEDFLPDDAEIIDVEIDLIKRKLKFLIYSKSFEPYDTSKPIDIICPIMHDLR